MRLNSLLGLGGLGRKGDKPPESKRRKHSDVLESLGLGGMGQGASSSRGHQSPSSKSEKEELMKWLAQEEAAPEDARPEDAAPEDACPAHDSVTAQDEAGAGTDATTPDADVDAAPNQISSDTW